MTLDEFSGGKKRRKPSSRALVRRPVRRVTKVKSSAVKKTRKVRRVRKMEGGKAIKIVRKTATLPKRPVAQKRMKKVEGTKIVYITKKGKPRGDSEGRRYVGKCIAEESAKKGRKLTRDELSKLFKRAWAEHKARKLKR